MKPGKLPSVPGSYNEPRLAFSERVKAAHAKVRAAGRDEKVDLSHLTAVEREFVLKTAHLPEDVDLNVYCAAWQRWRQQFTMPRLRGYVSDFAGMLAQPEVLRYLLGPWANPPEKSTGPKPAYSGSKAVMCVEGALGIGPHTDDNFEYLRGNPVAQAVCSWAFDEAAELVGGEAVPFRLANSTDSVLRHMHGVGNTCGLATTLGRLAMEANVRMLQSLAALNPNMPICVGAAIDGTAVRAWARQVQGKTNDQEAELRARASRAGFRCYSHDGGKHDVTEGEVVNVQRVKFWRGYYLVVLVDLCTGRPIVWTLIDASWKEARTLRELLRVLYELWPNCPLKSIVADGAWDEDESHQLCEVNYGVHLVASRTNDVRLDATHALRPDQSKLIASFNGRGEAFCRKHGKRLALIGNELPSREGLAPGEAAPESQFRLRFKGVDGCDCGSPSLQMRHHWTALAYYPHTPNDLRKRYAERHALLAHRNVCESLFNALKVGHGIATDGADRLRLTDFDTVHALIDLSFCMGTALMLGHERDKLGVGYANPLRQEFAA